MEMMDYAVLMTIIGALTVLTNLVTEVVKPFTRVKIPSEVVAVIIAEVLTLVAYFGWSDYKALPVEWYTVVAAVIVGLLVSYAAQFGFDKLKAALGQIGGKDGNT